MLSKFLQIKLALNLDGWTVETNEEKGVTIIQQEKLIK